MSDMELLPVARNAALAALKGEDGLSEDRAFPERGSGYRGYLVSWER
jgi:hypothetical protein